MIELKTFVECYSICLCGLVLQNTNAEGLSHSWIYIGKVSYPNVAVTLTCRCIKVWPLW